MRYCKCLIKSGRLGIFLASCIFMSSAALADDFVMQEDGAIVAGQQSFVNMSAYVQSDYFKINGMRCGTQRVEGDVDARFEKSTNDCTTAITSIKDEYKPSEVYEIPVWFHVIYKTDNTGNLSDATIAAQMKVLNEDFRAMSGSMGSQGYDTRVQFKLVGTTRTMNNGWFTDSAADEAAYKQALKRDTSKYLNIYSNDASGYLGYAYYPQGSAGSWRDGIVLNHWAVGGRNNTAGVYNQGRTLVHEMGHYLGLAHTFEGSTCSNTYTTGDLIVDTNAENIPHYGCTQTATCGTADPIHNYMDYTDDICMYLFTREQSNRAVCSLVNYRPNVYSVKKVVVAPMISPLIMSN